jgi:hypothetical protein
MATDELAPARRIESTFSNNARFYAPQHLTRQLQSLATSDRLALIIDVDALDRSTFARGDRVMTLALDALARVSVQVVLASRSDRAVVLQRSVPSAWCLPTTRVVAETREQLRGARLLAVSDDLELLATLGSDDRGIALTTGELSVRAVLWWLVDLRAKHGMANRR